MAESAVAIRQLLFQNVAREGRERRAAAREHAEDRSDAGASRDRAGAGLEVGERRHQAGDAVGEERALLGWLAEIVDDFTYPEQAHGQRHEAEPVHQDRQPEGVALGAGVDVGADQPEQESDDDHSEGFRELAAGQDGGGDQAENHQRKILGGTEIVGELGERRAGPHDEGGGDRAGPRTS